MKQTGSQNLRCRRVIGVDCGTESVSVVSVHPVLPQILSTGPGSPRLKWPSPRKPEIWCCPASPTWTSCRTSVRISTNCSRCAPARCCFSSCLPPGGSRGACCLQWLYFFSFHRQTKALTNPCSRDRCPLWGDRWVFIIFIPFVCCLSGGLAFSCLYCLFCSAINTYFKNLCLYWFFPLRFNKNNYYSLVEQCIHLKNKQNRKDHM